MPIPIRVSIDLGGVVTRHPGIYIPIMHALAQSDEVELYVLTDMDREDARQALDANGLADVVPDERLLCADWGRDGELCKAKICEEHDGFGIDLHIDDIPSYLLGEGTVGLLQMPSREPYYSSEWIQPEREREVIGNPSSQWTIPSPYGGYVTVPEEMRQDIDVSAMTAQQYADVLNANGLPAKVIRDKAGNEIVKPVGTYDFSSGTHRGASE